jgi:glyoxylase I family protein
MRATALHHVSVNVSDVDAALSFYVGDLGLRQRHDRPDLGVGGAWLDAGDQQIHLIQAAVPPNQGQHFALLVEDLDAVVDELRGRGLAVGAPTPIGRSRQAFITDPSGNSIELHQPS